MALATQCPHCKTTFRVAQDQLKLRGGIVRCGACHEIFDGNASLVDLSAAPAGLPSAAPAPAPAIEAPAAGAHEEIPVYTLDLGHALDPLGILPKPEEDEVADEAAAAPAAVPAAEPAPERAAETPPPNAYDNRVEPSLHDVDEETMVAPLPVVEAEPAPRVSFAPSAPVHTPLPQRASTDTAGAAPVAAPEPPRSARARQQARRSKLTPTRIEPPKLRVPEIDEPEFVRRGRQREQSGKRLVALWAGGAALLLLVLLAQAAYIFRNDIAVRAPALRPALASACTLLHCRVELPARIDNLTIETGDLQTLAPDTYVLTTLLHNQAGVAQAWPDIELALTDANDKALVRRVFAPADYLPKDAGAAGFAPRGEQPVKLYFQLDQLKPSGYHIAVFYP
ncbi:hypothetical protein GCM10027321_25370 [Massilia terrae]|uniref:Zinc-ribbon domain-containing protein n=1 Tax=Massilia terrae TaxID=1811224 RepID=A0ABT2CX43_9BURK|nr:zinc-ribbon and DUF3426 domain-containing protein [Massilia terrae]MCS0658543.1 zinc-ribbon domain-containing protein [Massilia terrae]